MLTIWDVGLVYKIMRIYCISDIHGCLFELEEVLSHVLGYLKEEDTELVLLGDYIYGGGAGMLMQAEPVYLCYEAIQKRIIERKAMDSSKRTRVVYLTPQGETFTQTKAEELAQEEDIIFLCGHYEGIDERVLEEIVTDNISIGDYVLTGGELPSMIVIDAVSRLVPGVLNNEVSAEFESFQDNLLEYPQYSRPEVWHDKAVPAILLSGHHANIEKWRHEQSIVRTKERRPDLWEKYEEKHRQELIDKKRRK